jgi:hypothetical protein
MRSEGGISAEEQPDRQPPVATSSRISGISGSGSGHVTVESVTVLELTIDFDFRFCLLENLDERQRNNQKQ